MASSKTKTEQSAKKAPEKDGKKPVASEAKKKPAKKGDKPGVVARIKTYFKNVRTEVKRVVWPTKQEMIKYTGAVLGMLVFFGVLIAIVDAVIVPLLYAFSGLR